MYVAALLLGGMPTNFPKTRSPGKGTHSYKLAVAVLTGAVLTGARYLPEGGGGTLGASVLSTNAPFEGSLPLLSHPSVHCPNASVGSPMPQR